jgi:hypothetical protein
MVIIDLSKRVMMTANVTLTDRVVYVVNTEEPLAGSTFGTIRYLSCSNKRQNGLRPKRSKKIGA